VAPAKFCASRSFLSLVQRVLANLLPAEPSGLYDRTAGRPVDTTAAHEHLPGAADARDAGPALRIDVLINTSSYACSGLAGGDPTTVRRRFHAPPGSRSQPPGAAAAIR